MATARACLARAALTALAALVAGGASGAAAGCGGGTAEPRAVRPAQPPPDAAGAATSAPPPPSAPAPALPGDGDRAFIADATGLVEVALPGGSQVGGSQVIAPTASWCSVDARANVVWFTTDQGLHAFDLADRRTRTIVQGDLAGLDVIIDWGAQQLGGESKLAFDVAAALRLAGTPALELEMGCEGDRAVYCFEQDLETPRPEVKAQQRRIGRLALVDPAYAARLARRGRQRSLWSPPPMPPAMPARKPVVDRTRCDEDPARCGELTAIPGSPLWLVHTANSRGDYFHETRELWDPATGEYVRRDGARLVRSKHPPPEGDGDTDHGGLRVSPAGVLSFGGAVFDAARVHHAPRDPDAAATSCGFASGGWRIAGPTDG